MHDLLNQVLSTLRGMWKYRRVSVLVAWLVAVIGAGAVLFIPDRFEASARVYVDTQSILRPLMSGLAVQPDVQQQITMLSRTLISRPTVERLIRMSDMDIATKSKAQQDALVESVTRSLEIKSTGRDNLYTLSYRDTSPQKAQRVVQSLLTIFVESSLGDSRKDSDSARSFIEDQIKNYEAKLSDAESKLKEFRLRNIDMQTGGGLDMAGRMAEASAAWSQARLELREAESAREAARRQLEEARARARAVPVDATDKLATPELDARIEGLRRNLDGLLQRFTEQHPDVVNTRRLIVGLEDQKRKEVAALRRTLQEAPPAEVAQSNPQLTELVRVFSAADVQVATLRARVGEYESRVARARAQLKVAPQIEAELAQLNRDYEINKKNYEDLVSRRESVVMTGNMESSSSLADFRVIDPPRVNPQPVAPNRVLLMPMALIAALAAGIGLSFLLSQIRPVIFDAGTLRSVTGLPVLGLVTLVRNDSVVAKEASSLRRFLGSVIALIVVFMVGMAVLSYHSGFKG